MATTQILLLKHVEYLGSEGEQAEVRMGYARNYLFPQKLAVPLNKANRKQIETLKEHREIRLTKERSEADELAQKIKKVNIAISVKTGPGGKLYGSVTPLMIEKRLLEEGIRLERKQFSLDTPVKALGKHSISIKLHPEVSVRLAFDVVSENPIEES